MRNSLSILMTLVLSFVPLRTVEAGTNGILDGTVRDRKTGEPIPGATVLIVGLQHGAAAGIDGSFELQNVRAGSYDVRVSHVGYRTFLLKNVVINPDLRTRLTLQLDPSDVELDEIVVTQEKPLIQKDVTGTTFIVSGEDVRALPVDNVLDVLGIKAGTTIEGNVRGGKSSEVVYLVDGLPVQDLMGGGASMTLPKSSVLGMSISTGGFEPEYGNALSGVVNIVTRTGGNTHRFFGRVEQDNLFGGALLGGTQTSKTTQFEGMASGPLLENRLYYVGVFGGVVTDTRWWQDFQGIVSSPVEQRMNGVAKLDFALTPTFRLGLQGLMSVSRWRDYDFAWRYNLGGLPPERKRANRVALSLSHSLSENFFYTASLSRQYTGNDIGEGDAGALSVHDPYQYDFFLRYVVSGQRAWWARTGQATSLIKVDGTLKAERVHLLKFGAEFNVHDLNSDIVRYEPRRTYFGKPLANEPQLNFSSSYRYRPRSGAIYVQDKIDLLDEGILLNVGARYDFLDPRAERPAIEATLQGDTAYAFTPGQMVPASVKGQISPRFGAAMQLAENGYLFINLGWYFQYPLFDYLYAGIDRVALGRGISAITGNPNLEPERSKLWEISIKYSFPYNLVASATYFKKETSNLIDTKTFVGGDSKVAGNYGFAEYVNTPFAETYGLEILVARERGAWVTGELSYSYMIAEGSSGSASDGFYIAQFGLPPGIRVYPLSWDQRHTVKAVANVTLPWDLNLSGVLQWHTGRPYTSYPSATGFDRVQGGRFYQNNDRMPAYFTLDVRVEKTVVFGSPDEFSGALTLDVRNLTNEANVRWIDANGRVGGELGDPSGYFIGRRTSIGFQASW
jgi:outer membrane receptor for ferrienterochelin and colicin